MKVLPFTPQITAKRELNLLARLDGDITNATPTVTIGPLFQD
jgi:hypothetical protein